MAWLSSSPPGHLANPRVEPRSPALHVGCLPLSHQGSPSKCKTNPNGSHFFFFEPKEELT